MVEGKVLQLLAEVALVPTAEYRQQTLDWLQQALSANPNDSVRFTVGVSRTMLDQYLAGERDNLGYGGVAVVQVGTHDTRHLWLDDLRARGYAVDDADEDEGTI